MTYKSKVSFGLTSFLIGLHFIIALSMIVIQAWVAIIIIATALIVELYFIFGIRYIVEGKWLQVKCRFFNDARLDITQITRIKPSKNILSAPAASLDRLAIYTSRRHIPLLVSPKEKSRFVNELLSINPDIDVAK